MNKTPEPEIINDFVLSVLDQVKLNLQKQFEEKANDLLKEFRKELFSKCMLALNDTKIRVERAVDSNCIEVVVSLKEN